MNKYDTDAKYDYDESLKKLQKERNYRAEALAKYQAELQALQQQLDAQNKLNAAKTQEPPVVDDAPKLQDENTKLDEQNGKLKENITLKGQANGQSIIGADTSGTKITPTPTQTIPDGVTSAEAGELETVRAKLVEVTNAVNTKTQAFLAEQKAVKSISQSEEKS